MLSAGPDLVMAVMNSQLLWMLAEVLHKIKSEKKNSGINGVDDLQDQSSAEMLLTVDSCWGKTIVLLGCHIHAHMGSINWTQWVINQKIQTLSQVWGTLRGYVRRQQRVWTTHFIAHLQDILNSKDYFLRWKVLPSPQKINK